MARYAVTQLSALCTIISVFYLSRSLATNSLTERPGLSSVLVLFFSGCLCFAASFFTKWLPSVDGRLNSSTRPILDEVASGSAKGAAKGALLSGSEAHRPHRPRKFFFSALISCVVLRVQVFSYLSVHQQCATPGLESFLCLFLIGYEIFATRHSWIFPTPADPDDPWRSTLHDLHDWFSGQRVVMFLVSTSALIFCIGTAVSISVFPRSSYICFSLIDSAFTTFMVQTLGVCLDAAIVVLAWRLLAWASNTKTQLRNLTTILMVSSFCIFVVWATSSFYSSPDHQIPRKPLYSFDVMVNSIVCACLLVSATIWVCESSIITPAAVLTFTFGIWDSTTAVFRYGDWLHLSPAGPLTALYFTSVGAVLFTYFHDLRSVVFMRRGFIAFTLLCLLITASIFSGVKQPPLFRKRHVLSDIITQAGVDHDRWSTHATASKSLPVAVVTYQERNNGRIPPPKFGDWFQYAKGSVSIDEYPQIRDDLEAFWSFPPSALRARAELMASSPDVNSIVIRGGKVSSTPQTGSTESTELDELAKMIEKFSQYLPDMILPINLDATPYILPSWEDAHSQVGHDLSSMIDLISRRSLDFGNDTESSALTDRAEDGATHQPPWQYTSALDFRDMISAACPPGSPLRARPEWNPAEMCWDCVRGHSRGQVPTELQDSLDICSQPDLKYLHTFLMTRPQRTPIRQLMPLFGPSKTQGFSDILIPLPKLHSQKDDNTWQFSRKYDRLIWRGGVGTHDITDASLRGGQKFRLLHLAYDDVGYKDDVTMVLPLPGKDDEFHYERVPSTDANKLTPFSFGFGDSSACKGDAEHCELVKQAYSLMDNKAEPSEYRYVLLIDDDDRPPPEFLRLMRSHSVPFLATIFQTWYTSRLQPWLHFVPVDLRYQGLHTTLSYFTGTQDRDAPVNGRDIDMKGRFEDAEWIAQQGWKWADKAISQYEMEVYMFRLLLEWGRLIDDNRDSIGVRRGDDGQVVDSGWSQPAESQAS